MSEIEKIIKELGCELYDTESVSENGHAIYRVYITKSGGVSLDECQKVKARSIDSVLNGERCTFIKMDIEGSELNALRGAEKTIGLKSLSQNYTPWAMPRYPSTYIVQCHPKCKPNTKRSSMMNPCVKWILNATNLFSLIRLEL